MASVKDISKENLDNQTEDPDDIRGDGKKKKFKPLSAVRKFFGGGKKRKKEDGDVVAVKARSTTALHSSGYDDDDDDDDGGFKSHQKPSKPLVGTRSISEDSIFSPEPREQPPPFTKVAVSEESLPKSTFQSELFSKLNKRRSQYSDDDQDEGIPRSPVPVLTTADVVAEPLKPLTFGKKHSGSTRDSEQSLISVDGSDMEDDLFTAKWKTSVPSRKSLEKPRMSDTSDLESLDFSSIEKTEVLKSTAAKDRISIKPQSRRASRLSRKKKESSLSKSLPCLNEELSSPTNKADKFSKTTYNKNALFDDIDINKLDAKTAIPMETASKSSSSSTNVALSSSAPGKSQDLTRIAVSSSSSQNSGASVVTLKGKDGRISPQKDKEKKVAFNEEDHSSIRKSTGSASPSLKVSDPDSDVTMSPREGYKLKRQNRSKTLPTGSTEDENSTKVQRASSHRAPASSSPEEPPPPATSIASSGSVKKLGSTRFSQFESSNASEPSWINKAKQKKLEQSESEDIDAKKQQPSESSVRRRSYDNILASSSKSSEPVTSQTTKHVPSSTTPSSKVTTDANTSNSRTAESDKDKDKKVEASTTSSSSSNSNLNNKRPSIDISSTKRESIDIDVRGLSSIKQRTASFNTTGKAENANVVTNRTNTSSGQDTTAKIKSPTSSSPPPKSSGPVSMSERAKLFSGANSSSSPSSSSSSSSSSSTTAKPPTGVSHSRSGSVKTSPTKSHDSSASVPFRPGSVKGSPFSSSGISASSSSSNIKSDSSSSPLSSSSSSTVKRETSDTTNNAVTKPSSLASSANAKFSSSSPNSKVSASSPSQQTPSSIKTSSPVSSSSSSSSSSSISANSSSFSKNNLPAGRAFSSFSSVAKPPITSSASASNVSKSKSNNNQQESSSSTSPSTLSSSSTTTTTSPSSSSNSSTKSFPKTQSSPIRSHASFTATSPFRPQISSSSSTSSNTPSSSLSSRTSALSKSTSMKVSSPVQSPVITKTEDKKKETTTTTTNQSNVPAWRANLQKADMKIEIIEKKSPSGSSSPATNQPSQSKNENSNSNKFGNNSRVTEMAKKSESSPTIEKAAVSSSNRSSKVLDMVKNFQNLQVST